MHRKISAAIKALVASQRTLCSRAQEELTCLQAALDGEEAYDQLVKAKRLLISRTSTWKRLGILQRRELDMIDQALKHCEAA